MAQWLIDTKVIKKKYPVPIINLAILKFLLGDLAYSCELLEVIQKNRVLVGKNE